MYGNYYMSEGYAFCFNPYAKGGAKAMNDTLDELRIHQDIIFDDSLKAITFTGTAWQQDSNFLINWTALFEQNVQGSLLGERLDADPFMVYGMMSEDIQNLAYVFLFLRVLIFFWLVVNSIMTVRRNRSLNEAFSAQTTYGVYTSVMILGFQIYSLVGVKNLLVRPFGTDQIMEEDVVTRFWMFSGLAHDY